MPVETGLAAAAAALLVLTGQVPLPVVTAPLAAAAAEADPPQLEIPRLQKAVTAVTVWNGALTVLAAAAEKADTAVVRVLAARAEQVDYMAAAAQAAIPVAVAGRLVPAAREGKA